MPVYVPMKFFSSSSKATKDAELRKITVSADGNEKQGHIQKKSSGRLGMRNWKTRYITVNVHTGLLKIYGAAEDVVKGSKERG